MKNKKINFKHIDIPSVSFKKADMFISLYTMQFINPKYRQELFKKIYKSLNWGGSLVIFEKFEETMQDPRYFDISLF